MKRNINFLISLMVMIFTGCNSDDKWEPGPNVEPDNARAYFPSSNGNYFEYLMSDTDKSFEITVSRKNTSGSASISVNTMKGSEFFQTPASIEFAAGEGSATIKISLTATETGKPYQLSLALDEKHQDPYNALGGIQIELTAFIADWDILYPDVLFKGSPNFLDYTADIYYSPGMNQYKILDFLNSGVEFVFELDEKNIVPITGQTSGTYWYHRDDNGVNYPVYLAPVDNAVIDYCFMYLAGYSTMDIVAKSGRFYFYFYYTGGAANGYHPITFDW